MPNYDRQTRGGSHALSPSEVNGGSGAAEWAIARYGGTDSQSSIPGSNVIQITPPSDNVLTGGRRRKRPTNRSMRNKNMKRGDMDGGRDHMDGGRDHMKRGDMDGGRDHMKRDDMDGGRDHMKRGDMNGGRDHMKRGDMGRTDHMKRGDMGMDGGADMGMDGGVDMGMDGGADMGMDGGVDMSENMETEDTGMGGGTGCKAVNGGRKSGGRGVFTNVAVPALLLYANNTFRRRKTMTKPRKSKKNKSTKTKKSRRGKR